MLKQHWHGLNAHLVGKELCTLPAFLHMLGGQAQPCMQLSVMHGCWVTKSFDDLSDSCELEGTHHF